MPDVECPYCGEWVNIDHDDGQGYEEGVLQSQFCRHCEKCFAFTTAISFSYEAQKADCLNDGEHKWEPTHTYPIEATKMECVGCGDRRKPTKEEWDAIRHENTPTPKQSEGITASNTRIGGDSVDSPKSPDSDFANSQDVNRNKGELPT